MKPIRLGLVCIALLASLTACGNGDEPQASATASSEASATPGPTDCSVDDASEDRKSVESELEVAVLTDVRQTSEGCPRIVFEFQNVTPGYIVEYAEPPFTDCGEGARIETDAWDAEAYLMVQLEPATGYEFSGETPVATYDGPLDIDVGGEVLKHMKRTCDFEANTDWIVGLDTRHEFAVRALTEPPRIVIDISQSA